MPTSPDRHVLNEVTIDHVHAAAERLRGVALRTPVHTSRQLDERTGASVFLKCESFQRIGAFKIRGAYNALSRLSDEQRARGVLTYSSGNHAQAIALAGRLLGVRATIVMPSDAPAVKLAATLEYLGYGVDGDEQGVPAEDPGRLERELPPPSVLKTPLTPSPSGRGRRQTPHLGPLPADGAKRGGAFGEVVQYDKTKESREELGAKLAAEGGLTVIPPYDHPDVIAGQGTVALELFEEVGELDALYVPCGGGGLLSGCATVAKAVCPGCRVIGVEPAAGDDATRSFRSGELCTVHNPETIADGARTPSLGRYTFPIVMDRVDEMMTVSDAELVRAMRFVWERMKLVIEPTGALGVAGMLKRGRSKARIGVIVSGGNVDLSMLASILALAQE